MQENRFRHESIHVGNLKMHYVASGEGPLMVMIHGFPEFWYSWRHQIPAMSERFRVIAPDMRGYNQTEKPLGIGNYKLSVLMEDVRGLIEALGEKKAVIVAHDWGGAVAWSFAMSYPEMTEKLIVMNCPPPRVMMKHVMRNPSQLRRSYYMFLFQIPFLPEIALRLGNYRLIEKAFRGWAIDKSAFSDEDIRFYKEAASKPFAMTCAINYYRAAFRYPSNLPLLMNMGKVKCPTLVIWAEEDKALGKEMTYDFKNEVEGPLTIEYIPKCSHWVQQEKPYEVNGHLRSFLSEYGF